MAEQLNDGLVRVGGLLWVRCKLRKPCHCGVSGRYLRDKELAWRPLTNSHRRGERIADATMRGILKARAQA